MRYVWVLALIPVLAAPAVARNVDLVTLPPRETVQLTIYNSEDLTLVRETRSVTFKKGLNRLQFSWAGTLIDPTSVFFRPVEEKAAIEVLDTTFPQDRPEVLIWNVESKVEGQVKVEVSYFTSGISWAADYVMITDAGETEAVFDGYVTVVNNSGEDYDEARVRLLVGVVNLVEPLRDDLRSSGSTLALGDRKVLEEGRARQNGFRQAEAQGDWRIGGGGTAGRKAPEVVKEGLSEYFIFTVEGTQTIPNGWSQRMVSFQAAAVPFDVLYRYRPHQYGERPVRFFLLANDEEHEMGSSPLPDGMIRVFREGERDGLAYYTTQSTKYVPIKEKIELNVGTDDPIVYERVILDVTRSDFVFDERQRIPPVVGWNERRTWEEEIRNYRAKPIRMEIRHVIGGDVEFTLEDSPTLFDFQTVEYTVTVAAGKTHTWTSQGLFRFGRNQKQNRIRLVE